MIIPEPYGEEHLFCSHQTDATKISAGNLTQLDLVFSNKTDDGLEDELKWGWSVAGVHGDMPSLKALKYQSR